MPNKPKPQHSSKGAEQGARQHKKRWSEMPYQTKESEEREARVRGERLPPVFNSFDATRNEDAERKLRREMADYKVNPPKPER